MKPGPELDALVHAVVFRGEGLLREFSVYSEDAWLALECARLRGSYVTVGPSPDGTWRASRDKALNPRGDGTADGYDDTAPSHHVRASTAAHAICLALVAECLPEESRRQHVIECLHCETTEAEPHLPYCPFRPKEPVVVPTVTCRSRRCGSEVPVPDLDEPAAAELRALLADGEALGFIARVREVTGLDLRSSKAFFLHVTSGTCVRCRTPVPDGRTVECPKCGALNIRL